MTHKANGENGPAAAAEAAADQGGDGSEPLLLCDRQPSDRVLVSRKTAYGVARGRGARRRQFPFFLGLALRFGFFFQGWYSFCFQFPFEFR
jgi:hypothetical protein